MTRNLRIIGIAALSLIFFSAAFSQTNPFETKQKAKVPGSVSSPAPVLSVDREPAVLRGFQPFPVSSYTPGNLSLSSLELSRAGFTQQNYTSDGRLIFAEGAVEGAVISDRASGPAVEQACHHYLGAIRNAMGIVNPAEEFRVKTHETDDLGMDHIKMQQYFQGIPVWCAEVVLHTKENRIAVFNGNFYPTPALHDVESTISETEAIEEVVRDVSQKTFYRELSDQEKEFLTYDQPAAELVIYHKDRNPQTPQLAWHVTVRPNLAEVWQYFVDARQGTIIHSYDNTHRDGDVTASGQDLNGVTRNFHAYLENSVYYLVDISRPMFNSSTFDGILAVYDAQNTNPANQNFNASMATSSNNSWSPGEVSAMYNSGMAYEYFRTVHGRNSYNNQGGAIKAIINVGGENGGGFDNAFWNGVAVFYGNGDVAFKPLAGSLDVGAHEIGHAFESSASNLEYQYESGALAESFADFAGAAVERQNWLIGEQVVKPAYFPSGCLRDMSDPHNGGTSLNDPGYQPAHVSEMYTGSEDNGGVHINSGICNLAFYKTSVAIGLEKTEKIFWRASFNYLTRSSQFIDMRLNCIQSAKDLYGGNSSEAAAVASAFDFVGITDGQGGNYENQLPLNPGPDYVLLYDLIPSDPYTLYLSSTAGSDFIPLSQTVPINKPSVVDDGSFALFVSDDNKLRYISLEQNPDETIIQDEAIWQNVATSKDGNLLSAITVYEDSAIWVYSYTRQEWAKFHLYNATTAQGQETHTVIYADAMEWDYSGEYIIYDALSRVENPFGEPIEWWDINFIKVWDRASNNWGSGDIFKVFGGLPEGLSVGNPSFAKNSPFIFAFDIFEPATNTVTIAAANFESGAIGEIFINDGVLGTPNYSKSDNKLIFTVPDDLDAIAVIDLQPDKLNPAGQASYLITEAMWGIWFAQGERSLDVPEAITTGGMRVYPNPGSGLFRIDLDPAADGAITLKVFDTRGGMVRSVQLPSARDCRIDLQGLPSGIYFLQVQGDKFMANEKLMIR